MSSILSGHGILSGRGVLSGYGVVGKDGGGSVVEEPPVNLVLPQILGIPVDGETLTVTNGMWANSPTEFSYLWFADGVPSSEGPSNTFLVSGYPDGTEILALVRAINAFGNTPVGAENSVYVINPPGFVAMRQPVDTVMSQPIDTILFQPE